MIVSITVTTALDSVPLGGGAVTPQVGISPAIAEPDRTHVKAIVSKSRFIDVSPILRLRRCKLFYIELDRTSMQGALQDLFTPNYYPVCNRSNSHFRKTQANANYLSEVGNRSPYGQR
jgi:hypothetical protein